MDHSRVDDQEQARQRRQLIEFVSHTDWNGPTVIDYCHRCELHDLQAFVSALKAETGSIPLGFRWASDDDMDWLSPIECRD